MPPIKLKLSLGGVRPSAPSTPASTGNGGGPLTPQPAAQVSGSSTPQPRLDDERAPSLRVVLPLSTLQSGAATSTAVSTPGPSAAATPSGTPVSTPSYDPAAPVKRKRGRPRKHPLPPTAIPPHLATTPRSAPISLSPPASSVPTPSTPYVKLEPEDDADPLASWSLSPSMEYDTPLYSASTPATPWRDGSEDTLSYQRPQQKWKRVKKPFKELANKILSEMRRKDEYGFFLEPVNADDYPGYHAIIGGIDKAMDLGTMQKKVKDGVYSTIDELEADARLMHAAAHAFNLPDTVAYREADKVFKHGMKHIERSRPLVRTPTASPSPSARASALPDSDRNTPARSKDIKPEHLIPEAMLDFPANSLQAKAVGWHLTGGRRVRAKRLVRGREKFIGKWRDMLPDGSYDVAEMDDPVDMLEHLRTRKASSWSEMPDWEAMRREDEDWWEWDGLGGPTGQPPLPGAARLKPKPLRMKTLDQREFGRFDEVTREILAAREAALPEDYDMPFFSEMDDVDLLSAHLRPDPSRVPKRPDLPPQNFVDMNAGKPAVNYVYDMAFGDVRGEAYAASVKRFLQGAGIGPDAAANGRREGLEALREYAENKWHDGILKTRASEISRNTASTLSGAAVSGGPHPLLDSARAAYARLALRELTRAENPLDLQPLLREPADFLHVGVGGKSGVEDALAWVGNDISRAISERTGGNGTNGTNGDGDVEMAEPKRIVGSEPGAQADPAVKVEPVVNGAKRRAEDAEMPDAKRVKSEGEAKPDVADTVVNGAPAPAGPPGDGEDGLRRLRLELVALSKFYPLASLRKMEAHDAVRLLPANVRSLMTRQPAPAPAASPVPTPSVPGTPVPASPIPQPSPKNNL